ncbi:hypothetical protein HK105_207960 [Polyrhizophydium stewartii]|uniref:Uncharacterized protein n=1 Tax=Polyrhizophydium stewartii TaxID=2732419 RepID=A0ABR4MZ73_9FUNG
MCPNAPLANSVIVGTAFTDTATPSDSNPASCFGLGDSAYLFQQLSPALVVPWKCASCPARIADAAAQCYSLASENKTCAVLPTSDLRDLDNTNAIQAQVQDQLKGDWCFVRKIVAGACTAQGTTATTKAPSPAALVFDCSPAGTFIPPPPPPPTAANATSARQAASLCVSRPILDQYFWMRPESAVLFSSDACAEAIKALTPAGSTNTSAAQQQSQQSVCVTLQSASQVQTSLVSSVSPRTVSAPSGGPKTVGTLSIAAFISILAACLVVAILAVFGSRKIYHKYRDLRKPKAYLRPAIVELPPFDPTAPSFSGQPQHQFLSAHRPASQGHQRDASAAAASAAATAQHHDFSFADSDPGNVTTFNVPPPITHHPGLASGGLRPFQPPPPPPLSTATKPQQQPTQVHHPMTEQEKQHLVIKEQLMNIDSLTSAQIAAYQYQLSLDEQQFHSALASPDFLSNQTVRSTDSSIVSSSDVQQQQPASSQTTLNAGQAGMLLAQLPHAAQSLPLPDPPAQVSLPMPTLARYTSLDDQTVAVAASSFFPSNQDMLDFTTGEEIQIVTLWNRGVATARNETTGRFGLITVDTWRNRVLRTPHQSDQAVQQ